MRDPGPEDYLVDPLSEITRKERRNLLLATMVGVLVSKAGLVPTKLAAFGVELAAPAQKTFVLLVALSVLYFIGAFLTYGISDFLIWRKKYQDYLEAEEIFMQGWSMEDQRAYDELRESIPDITWLYRWSKPTAFIRILFEYAVPLLFGIYTVSVLIQRAY